MNQSFRRSLVCRDDVEMKRHISSDAIKSCIFRGRILKDPEAGWIIQKFGGMTTAVADPTVTAVLDTLDAALPLALTFEELRARLANPEPVDEEHLCAILLSLLSLDAVSFRTWSPEVAARVGDRPVAFWPARKLAALGHNYIPNPFHGSNPEEPFIVRLVELLDGTRTRGELASAMKTLIEDGKVNFEQQPDGSPSDEDTLRLVTDGLERIRRDGLLV